MQLTARPYLAAGVALVGASAIAISPLAPPAPDVHLPAVQASSAAVSLSAATNPLEAWTALIGTTFDSIGGLGEQWMADPAPILTQIIANQLYTVKALGDAAQMAQGMADIFLPIFADAVRSSIEQIAAGEFEAGLSGLISSFVVLALPLQTGIGAAWPAITRPFVNLGQFVTHLNDGVPAVLANGLLSPLMATAGATGHTLDTLVSSAKSGDVAELAGTLLAAPATITDALLNGYTVSGYDAAGLLTPEKGFIPGGAVASLMTAMSGLANAIKTPGADRGNLFGNLPGLPALDAAPETASVSSALGSTAKTVTLDVAPATSLVAEAPATVETSTPQAEKTDKSEADAQVADAGSTEGDNATKTAAKLSTKASPKASRGESKANSAKAVRDQVKSAVKKMTSGLKKDKAGTPKKATSSAGSAKSSDE